jgi:hypothetical protein
MNHLGYFLSLLSERTPHYLTWSWRLTIPLTLAVIVSGWWAAWRVRPFPFRAAALQVVPLAPILGTLALGAWFECVGCDEGAHHAAVIGMHLLLVCQGIAAVTLVLISRRIRAFAACSQGLFFWCAIWAWVAAREPGPFL